MKELNLNLDFLNKVSDKDKAFFARQIATMLDSGLSLDKALRIFVNQTRQKKLKEVLKQVLVDIESGASLSDALKKHQDVFDHIFINIVISGEAIGKLADVLKRLAASLEQQNNFMDKIKGAMYYPVFIILVMIVIVVIMITQVIPPLKDIFGEFGANLPWTTQMLLGISDFVVGYWWVVVLVLVAIAVFIYYYLATLTGQYYLAKLYINTPGGIGKDVYMARFCQTMSMLLHAGTPIIKTLEITSQVMNNLIYKDILQNASRQMERGIPLSTPLDKEQDFSALVPQMIRVGEETGKLDQVLENLSTYFEEQANTKLKNVSSLIEPVIIVIIGIGVTFIVFSVIMPIYQLVQIQ